MNKKVNCFIKLINEMKKAHENASFGDNVFVTNIPEKKLSNAINAMKVPKNETPLILFDDTAFGSAKDGMLFTDWGIHYKENGAWSVSWDSLFKRPFNLNVSDKWPVLISYLDDQKRAVLFQKEIVLYMWLEKDTLSNMILAGAYILGNPDEIEVNSFEELYQYMQKRLEKHDDKITTPAQDKESIETKEKNAEDQAGAVVNVSKNDEKTSEPLQNDKKIIETTYEQDDKQTVEKIEETPVIQKVPSENKPVEIHPIQINKKIVLVCDKNNSNIDTAKVLLNLINQSCSDEPELRSYVEYKTISFEAELLGEEQDFYAIFFMTSTSPAIVNVTWKFNKCGIRYGWNAKKAAIFAENSAYINEENKSMLAKYGGKDTKESLARMFYHEEIQKFINGEA